ncbi:hypothetical protein DFQ14_106183 [Halopolyspora algeriensis]|uniref:Uncharacterized protein n=1 Tax=Halopolyspora algeriensis TaxID=1500506 RepID=A0A368VQC4_9ACTN|nr:gephyrin-like molybdotransferase receptor GlpR [Halopolyspora algeriensis]RCW43704.1 hypothetical protein DFQ14_106183 [Halopolyspora algeriensis]TQM47513.1 hypothetical protein FHU43_3504 [Halopolyspora algeriensis]
MLSSLIFVALAVAWLVVLVPMFARRRQEVAHTTDSALGARVVRRGGARRRPTTPATARTKRVKEVFAMPDTDRDDTREDEMIDDLDPEVDAEDEYTEDGQWRRVYSDDARAGRRYRPGRGGFDPEAAALAARAKYARRQRTVFGMLLVAVVTAVLAALAWPVVWWVHALVDLALAGYLTYLRRQVKIEEDVRARRLARLSGDADPESGEYEDSDDHGAADEWEHLPEFAGQHGYGSSAESPGASPQAVALDIDDEDPMFDELDERTWQPYRRAAGD